jgi:uncharacterized protein (TIGR00369 family)
MIESSRISIQEFEQLCNERVPSGGRIKVESLAPGRTVVRLPFDSANLRPGGTLSGPAQMALADVAMYAVVLSLIGRVELAVTTNLNINFLRRPIPADLLAHGQILKLGKRLAVGEVTLYADGDPQPVAHVTSTYSIPPHAPID